MPDGIYYKQIYTVLRKFSLSFMNSYAGTLYPNKIKTTAQQIISAVDG